VMFPADSRTIIPPYLELDHLSTSFPVESLETFSEVKKYFSRLNFLCHLNEKNKSLSG
jgi:hypothetical protein